MSILLLAGCEEQICSYCGQTKQCDEFDILGTKRYICQDCLGNKNMSLSGNVIGEYESPLVDPMLYLPAGNTVSDNNVEEASVNYTDISASINSASDNSASTTGDTSNTVSSKNKDDLISAVASNLSAAGFSLAPDDDVNDKYHIYSDGNVTGISILFQGDTRSTRLKISMKNGASDQDFASVCIYAGLACLGSADYDNNGVSVFNAARDHGNYTRDNCSFYYLDGLDPSTNEGAVAIYEISCE